jgi:hypothetical protein
MVLLLKVLLPRVVELFLRGHNLLVGVKMLPVLGVQMKV